MLAMICDAVLAYLAALEADEAKLVTHDALDDAWFDGFDEAEHVAYDDARSWFRGPTPTRATPATRTAR